MKLLLDQGLPRGAVPLLKAALIDTIHVGDVGLARAKDASLIEFARGEDRAIVTLDSDFHDALTSGDYTSPSVIRIRIERLKAQPLADLLIQILPSINADLEAGALVTVQVGRIRVRRLPLA